MEEACKLTIMLDPEDIDSDQDIGDNTGDNYIKVEMPFNSLMTEFFEGSHTDELLQHRLAHTEAQLENPQMCLSGFMINEIMHLHINFRKLVLIGGSSYVTLQW